jgi:EAL domain-containing protein (putative c-di-GMP-specific phosphodiesterase class I)
MLPGEARLAVNVSPLTALSPGFFTILAPRAKRVIIEVTEHERVEDYDALNEALAPLRDLGAWIAIDDVGAGFASLSHILRLSPDIVKLDLSLTRGIAADPARDALASSLVDFASGIDATSAPKASRRRASSIACACSRSGTGKASTSASRAR